jgi:XTP/dITP diphosphohydrolase
MRDIVIASKNDGKIREVRRILQGLSVRWLTWRDLAEWPELEETGDTFLDNALIKAGGLAAATGLAALADDSGLEVDALGAAPGVRSARYGGEDGNDELNVRLLLSELKNVPPRLRAARFVCCVVLFFPGGKYLEATGTCEGTIAPQPLGGAGFGYDPVFVPAGRELTFAQLTPGEKDALSHRGRALEALRACLLETALPGHAQEGP